MLSTNENCKVAAKLIQEFGHDINDHPAVKERLMKGCMRYYLGRYLYKKPTDDQYMTLDKIEDLFEGFRPMMTYLAEDLFTKGKKNEAKGLCVRHNLKDMIRDDLKENFENYDYSPEYDIKPEDHFGPLAEPSEDYVHLPESVKLEIIDTEAKLPLLDKLLEGKYVLLSH